MALNNQETGDEVRSIIGIGKERRYLLPDEEEAVLPAVEVAHEPEDGEQHLAGFEPTGIAGEEDVASASASQAIPDAVDAEHGHVPEEGELDLTPGMLDKNNDPVRLYLREMGTVPLLKRADEVAIAKRMERGRLMVLKTISRSPIVLKELITVGKELRDGTISIKKIVQFDQEELTEEETESKTQEVLRIIAKIEELYAVALKQAAQLEKTPKSKKRLYLRTRNRLARTRVEMSLLARSIDFHPLERNRLIEKIHSTVERLQSLEREIAKLERRAEASKGEHAAEARRELRARRAELREIEVASETGLVDLKRMLQIVLRGEAEAEPGQEGNGRGQPAPGRFHRQEIHQPRTAIPGPDSGRQHRPDEGRGQIRMAPRLQVLDVRDLVDPPGRDARHRRSGPHDSRSRAHDRNHQQAGPHQPPDGAGTGPRAERRGDSPSAWTFRSTKSARRGRSPSSPFRSRRPSARKKIRTSVNSSRTSLPLSPSDAAISISLQEQTESLLKTLTPREERVIKMRFGLEDGSEHTLEEVGHSFAVTRERIRQIEAKALRKLRHPSRSRNLRSFLENTLRTLVEPERFSGVPLFHFLERLQRSPWHIARDVALPVRQFQIGRLHQRVDVGNLKHTFLRRHRDVIASFRIRRTGSDIHLILLATGR